MELSERKEKILAAVVEQYIKTGEPVGSKTLLDSLDMSVSSATVRNEMADLGYLGLLDQPHTSAGRVPTGEGYRYYVDNLVPESELSDESRRLIDAGIGNANGDPESLLRHAGEALAYLTECAAVMTTPSGENTKIKRVELVPISPHTAMIVLLASNGILRSKLFRLDSPIDTTVCETFYNVAQAMLIGVPVSALTPAYLQSIAARLGMESLAMFPMLSAVAELSQNAAQPHVFLSGQSNLLHHREYAGRSIRAARVFEPRSSAENPCGQHEGRARNKDRQRERFRSARQFERHPCEIYRRRGQRRFYRHYRADKNGLPQTGSRS